MDEVGIEPAEAAPVKPHRRRWIVLAVVLTVLVVLPVAAYFVTDAHGRAAVRREIERIEARGETLDWEKLAPPPVPDDENAALVYLKAFRLLNDDLGDSRDVLVQWLDQAPWDEEDLERIADERHGYTASTRPARPDLTLASEAEAWEAARHVLAQNAQGFDLLRQANAMDRCRFPVNYKGGIAALLPHLAPIRSSARLLILESRVKRHDGDIPGAAASVRQVIRLERATHQPCLVPRFVGILVVGLATRSGIKPLLNEDGAHPDAWRQLLRDLETLDTRPVMVNAMQGERAMGYQTIENLSATGGVGPGGLQLPGVLQGPLASLWKPVLRYDTVQHLRYLGDLVAAARLDPWEALARCDEMESEVKALPRWAVLTRILAPALSRAFQASARAEADIALARVSLALKLYKHQHGAYPDTLAALSPAILADVPPDPFTGKPVFYRREGDGFILYSVGLNGTDDGGVENKRDPDQGDMVWKFDR